MIFKDGKTFSAYVRSKLHSGYITVDLFDKNKSYINSLTIVVLFFSLTQQA